MGRGTTPAVGNDDTPVEIEWQFDALDLRPVERWLAALPTTPIGLGTPTVTAQAKPSRRLVDRYLDTEDWRIALAGFVLRTRRRGRFDEATMKDRLPAGASGLRRRLEVTEQLPAGGLGDLGASGPVGRRIRAIAGQRALREVLEVRTRRRPFALRVGGIEVAEVALDETSITVTGEQRPVRLRRVEVEVDAGWVERLEPMVAGLRQSCGLQPATLSKFEAGLLSLGLTVPETPDLGSTDIGPETSTGELAYAVLRRHLAILFDREAGTRLGDDIEDLHDMRVATRRLRAALALFAQVLPVRTVQLRTELAWLADRLGAVRDIDVQLQRMDLMTKWTSQWAVPGESAGADTRPPLEHLASLLERERQEARGALLDALDSARWERLAKDLTALVTHPPVRRPRGFGAPAVTVTFGLVGERHHRVMKAARRARRSGRASDFHRLRIRCKHLRYALEFTADLYGGRTERFTRRLARLQDSLGLMQDAEVATNRLARLATADEEALPAATVFLMGGVAERYRSEAATLLEAMPSKLRTLNGGDWKVLAELMQRRQQRALEAIHLRAVPSSPPSSIPQPDVWSRNEPGEAQGTPAALSPPLPSASAALAAWPDPVWGPPGTDQPGAVDAVHGAGRSSEHGSDADPASEDAPVP